jgi:hypothetical protein
MAQQEIDHGDAVERRFTFLTSASDPRVGVLESRSGEWVPESIAAAAFPQLPP